MNIPEKKTEQCISPKWKLRGGIGHGLGRVRDILLRHDDLVPDNALRRKIWEARHPIEHRSDFHWKWTWPVRGSCRSLVCIKEADNEYTEQLRAALEAL